MAKMQVDNCYRLLRLKDLFKKDKSIFIFGDYSIGGGLHWYPKPAISISVNKTVKQCIKHILLAKEGAAVLFIIET